MNALVASVIRTLIPVIVGQVASWLLLAHVTLPASATEGLTAFVGGLLTAIYYVGVRVLEQQWPALGILLGLPSSPDTYSKDAAPDAKATAPTGAEPTTVTHVYNTAPAVDELRATVADAKAAIASAVQPAEAGAIDGGFQSKIEAAISGNAAPEALAAQAAPATPAQ